MIAVFRWTDYREKRDGLLDPIIEEFGHASLACISLRKPIYLSWHGSGGPYGPARRETFLGDHKRRSHNRPILIPSVEDGNLLGLSEKTIHRWWTQRWRKPAEDRPVYALLGGWNCAGIVEEALLSAQACWGPSGERFELRAANRASLLETCWNGFAWTLGLTTPDASIAYAQLVRDEILTRIEESGLPRQKIKWGDRQLFEALYPGLLDEDAEFDPTTWPFEG